MTAGGSRPAAGGIRAVIFDFDGVIADTEGLHFRCFRRVLAEEGIDIGDGETSMGRFLGINDRAGFRKAFREARRNLPARSCGDLVERKSAYYRSRLGEVRLFPGVKDLLSDLGGRIPLAIASGGRTAEIGAVLEAHGVRGLFPILVSADDVVRSKPSPDGFLRALEKLRLLSRGLRASRCLVIEDSLPGIRAARSAGMRCLAVAHTHPPRALRLADRVVDRLGDLRAEEVLGGVPYDSKRSPAN